MNQAQDFRDGTGSNLWSYFANIWLLFLVFPLLGVLASESLTQPRQIGAVVVLVAFAVTHIFGYAWIGRDGHNTELPTRPFALLGVLAIVGVVIGGPIMLGTAPFFTPYAASSFSLRTGRIVLALVLVAVIGTIVLTGAPVGLWIIALVTFAVGVGSLIARVGADREFNSYALQNQLKLSEDRSRVARDVHDVLGHSLTAIILKTQVAERQLASLESPSTEVVEAQTQLNEIHDLSREALAEIRDTVDGLRATTLEGELTAARQVLADADVALSVDGTEAQVPDEYHSVIGWTLREAVTNIVRHAEAQTCRVELANGASLIRICDDGVGRSGAAEGNGLGGLRQRLDRHGLELRVEDQPSGTAIAVVQS